MQNENPAHPTDLSKYLFSEEAPFFPDSFKSYYLTKRYNFIATVKNHSDLSTLYFAADDNWFQALRSLEQVHNGAWIVPVQLTIFCFRELRLAAELLFSCCTSQGYNHLRTAIEAFTHAQKIMREPALGKVWLERGENRAEYNRFFKEKVKDNLFPEAAGFSKLHGIWGMLCDAGAHASVTSLGISSSTTTSESEVLWRLEFFEVNQGEITKNVALMILCQLEMFKHTFNIFHERLSLDPHLLSTLHAHLSMFSSLKTKYMSGAQTQGI